MNKILNAQDAFVALQNGKSLLCRYLESDFLPLDQFPGTVFGNPEYQFCIEIGKIELAGMTFTKPYCIDELEDGQIIYLVGNTGNILKGKFISTFEDLVGAVKNGFIQRNEVNALLQMKAIQKALGVEQEIKVKEVDFGSIYNSDLLEQSSQVKQTRKRANKKEIEAHKDVILDAIASCLSAEELATTCHGLEKIGFNDAQLNAIELAKNAKLESLAAEKAAAESEAEKLFNQTTADATGPELSVLCEAFIDDIEKTLNIEDLNAIRRRINANGALTENELSELSKQIDLKTAAFDIPEAPAQKKYIEEEETKYQEKLATLKKRVDESKTPAEVNAAVKYTNSWSAEQREPLLNYMHKRLEELQQEKVAQQPSLMVQIQNAPDLTALDALEIDVAALDPVVQPEMMRIVRLRRNELEQAANDSSIEEDLP
ncbi:hypothetical protein [Acinetobacter vivianii]|uniref:hypothetical protein n=1 Tax=Acinetobacter vivianii TaxID=1776742 RepID=UPI0040434836